MTLTCKLHLDILKMHLYTKNEDSRSRLFKVGAQIHTQMFRDRTYYHVAFADCDKIMSVCTISACCSTKTCYWSPTSVCWRFPVIAYRVLATCSY